MFSEAKVTEIYCLADDFCKEFAKYQENHMLPTFHKSGKHHNKPNRECCRNHADHDSIPFRWIPMLQTFLFGICM